MALKIKGQLFEVSDVSMSELAERRAYFLQRRNGNTARKEAVAVHASVLLQFHVLGQHGHIHPDDRRLNRNNIQKNSGRVLTVVGSNYPFVIITELPSGITRITTPEEV